MPNHRIVLYDAEDLDFEDNGMPNPSIHPVDTLGDTAVDLTRISRVPASVLARHHGCDLLNKAISVCSLLALQFAFDLKYASDDALILSSCKLVGDSADQNAQQPTAGKDGGNLDLRTGAMDNIWGFEQLAYVGSYADSKDLRGSLSLDSGTHYFRQVLDTAEIDCQGDVTIMCKYAFRPKKLTIGGGKKTYVRIYAGESVTVDDSKQIVSKSSHYIGAVDFVARESGKELRESPSLVFWTSQRGRINVSNVNLSGGKGAKGGAGGNGGSMVVHANQANLSLERVFLSEGTVITWGQWVQ